MRAEWQMTAGCVCVRCVGQNQAAGREETTEFPGCQICQMELPSTTTLLRHRHHAPRPFNYHAQAHYSGIYIIFSFEQMSVNIHLCKSMSVSIIDLHGYLVMNLI